MAAEAAQGEGMAGQFGVVYGPPKHTKTSGLLATFPNALVIGVREDVEAVANNCLGFSPNVWPWFDAREFDLPADL